MRSIANKVFDITARFSRGGIVGSTFPKPTPKDFAAIIANPKPVQAPEPRSTVGFAVVNLKRMHGQLTDRRDDLTAEIERKTEELRQVNATLAALAKSLTDLSVDPALTTEERELAVVPLVSSLAGIGEVHLSKEAEDALNEYFMVGTDPAHDIVTPIPLASLKGA